MIMIVVRCWLNPKLGPPVEFASNDEKWKERWASLREIWPILVLIVAVMGGLYWGVVSPTESGAAGALIAIVIGVAQRKLSWHGFVDSFKDAIGTTAQLFFIGIGAVIYTKFLALSGSGVLFTELVGSWAVDPLLLVIAVSAIYLVLGMFLDPLGMILLTIPVFVPMFAALEPRSGLVRRASGEIYWHRPADAAGRLQHLCGVRRAQQPDPAHHHLPRLLLVPGLRGGDHDAADRVSADLAVVAEPDELDAEPGWNPALIRALHPPARILGFRPPGP